MKKTVFWVRILLAIAFLLLLLMFFFQNRETTILFNYLTGQAEMQLTTLLFLSFVTGVLFTLLYGFFIRVRKGYGKLLLNAQLKELKDENEKLKRELTKL